VRVQILFGALRPLDRDHPFESILHYGPLTRSVADAALMQNVMSGPHPDDICSLPDKMVLPLAPEDIKGFKVALSVDADDTWLTASIEALKPDLLQLHGKEPPARVAAIRKKFGLPVMKAIAVEEKADLAAIEAYAGVADRLIFDARAPRAATRPGGLGKSFDWRLLENLDSAVPFMLSGGLDAGNVTEALRITRAPGVDVSSGVERASGEKDADKIRAFVRAARAAMAGTGSERVTSTA